MVSLRKNVTKAIVVVSCGLSLGCANHIKVDTITETEVVRTKLSHTLNIETNTGSLVASPLISANVEESKTFKVATYEMKTDYNVETPYQGVRELYEFPLGVAALPVAVTVNLADFLLLGLIPNKFTDTLLDWSFAGINPFLNIESEERTERTILKSDKKLLDEREEHLKRPLSNKEIVVAAGDNASMKVTLDQNGKAEISLIRLSSLSDNIEKIKIVAESENVSGEKEIDVSRQLRTQLHQASLITKKYAPLALNDAKNSDVDKIELTVLARDLVALTKLGFESESLRIEKKGISLMSEEQRKTFKLEMDKALAPAEAVPSVSTAKAVAPN